MNGWTTLSFRISNNESSCEEYWSEYLYFLYPVFLLTFCHYCLKIYFLLSDQVFSFGLPSFQREFFPLFTESSFFPTHHPPGHPAGVLFLFVCFLSWFGFKCFHSLYYSVSVWSGFKSPPKVLAKYELRRFLLILLRLSLVFIGASVLCPSPRFPDPYSDPCSAGYGVAVSDADGGGCRLHGVAEGERRPRGRHQASTPRKWPSCPLGSS